MPRGRIIPLDSDSRGIERFVRPADLDPRGTALLASDSTTLDLDLGPGVGISPEVDSTFELSDLTPSVATAEGGPLLSFFGNFFLRFDIFPEIQKALDHYGSWPLSADKANEAQAVVRDVIRRLSLGGDPRVDFLFINRGDRSFYIRRNLGLGYHLVVISKGFLDCVKSLDELAAGIAHELAHTGTFGKVEGLERTVREQQEELLTADAGALKRMALGGFDPRALYRLLETISDDDHAYGNFWTGFLGTHPNGKIRISRAAAAISELENEVDFPDPRPLPDVLKEVQSAEATLDPIRPIFPSAPPESPPPPEPEKPKDEYVIVQPEELVRMFLQSPEYQELDEVTQYHYLATLVELPREMRHDVPHPFVYKFYLRLYHHYVDVNHPDYGKPLNLKEADEISENVTVDRESRAAIGIICDELLRLGKSTQNEALKIRIARTLEARLLEEDVARRHAIIEEVFPEPIVENFAEFKELELRIGTEYQERLPFYQRENILRKLLLAASEPAELLGISDEILYARYYDHSALKKLLLDTRTADIYWAGFALGRTDVIYGHYFLGDSYSSPKLGREDFLRIFIPIFEDERLSLVQRFVIARNADIRYSFGLGAGFFKMMVQRHVGSFAELRNLRREIEEFGHKERGALALGGQHGYIPDSTLYDLLKWIPLPITVDDVVAISDFYEVWRPSQEKKTIDELTDRSTGDRKFLEDLLRRRGETSLLASLERIPETIGLSSPAYSYDLAQSASEQGFILSRLQMSGNYPTTVEEEHRLFVALARRGATDDTDLWARRLYLAESFSNAESLEEVLAKNLVWDLQTRKELYQKYLELTGLDQFPLANRAEAIADEVARIRKYFPEYSLEREDLLEDFANRIQANHSETLVIDSAKHAREENYESVALRVFNGVLAELETYMPSGARPYGVPLFTPKERQFRFIKFLIGKGEFPEDIKASVGGDVGIGRLRRIFHGLTPDLRVALLDPLLRTSNGLFADETYRQELVDLALEGAGEYRKEAELLLNSLLYALGETSPYQQTFALAFIVGQISDKSVSPGRQLRVALESMGNTGVSIGQKLYQFRIPPPAFLDELADLQDQARKLTRLEIFELMSDVLGIPLDQIDKTIALEDVLGSASSKVVVQVRYLDGRGTTTESRALKMLRRNFVRSTEIEIRKVKLMLDYLEEHGGQKYRRLRSAFHAVERSIRLQADALAETRLVGEVRELYRSGEVAPSGFRFVVAEPDLSLSSSPVHLHESIAEGVSLKSLQEPDRSLVFGAVYAMEEGIAFRETFEEGAVTFEGDRHLGNFKVDLADGDAPTIYVYDYPLLHSITAGKRDAIFRVLGMLDAVQHPSSAVTKVVCAREAATLIMDQLSIDSSFFARRRAKAKVIEAIDSSENIGSGEVTDLLFDILSAAEEADGFRIDPSVYDYLTALGHMEHYAVPDPSIPGAVENSPFRIKLRRSVIETVADVSPLTVIGRFFRGLF